MGKIPAWKEKVWKAKFHYGYADVLYEDVWSLYTRLARIIANHLRAFLQAEKGSCGCIPGSIVEKYGANKGYVEWLNIIRKMIYAFEEYQHTDKWSKEDQEKQIRIREGMQLFINHYKDLWI